MLLEAVEELFVDIRIEIQLYLNLVKWSICLSLSLHL
jgi:hypothetical protein